MSDSYQLKKKNNTFYVFSLLHCFLRCYFSIFQLRRVSTALNPCRTGWSYSLRTVDVSRTLSQDSTAAEFMNHRRKRAGNAASWIVVNQDGEGDQLLQEETRSRDQAHLLPLGRWRLHPLRPLGKRPEQLRRR